MSDKVDPLSVGVPPERIADKLRKTIGDLEDMRLAGIGVDDAAWQAAHLEPLLSGAAAALDAQQARVEALTEQHDMQLAAISTATLSNTHESAAKWNTLDRDNPYWSVAYMDVCAAIQREIKQRERAESAERQVAEATAKLEKVETLAREWTQQARDERLRRGQMVGPRASYQVLENCAVFLGEALASVSPPPSSNIVLPEKEVPELPCGCKTTLFAAGGAAVKRCGQHELRGELVSPPPLQETREPEHEDDQARMDTTGFSADSRTAPTDGR